VRRGEGGRFFAFRLAAYPNWVLRLRPRPPLEDVFVT
jgi:hypothetical protein